MTKERRPRTIGKLPPRPVAVLRQALQERQATPPKERNSQSFLDDRSASGAKYATDHAARSAVSIEIAIEPFPVPREFVLSQGIGQCQLTPSGGGIKLQGPDAADVEAIVAAIRRRNMERRASWRRKVLALAEDDEQHRELLRGSGRVNVASSDTYQKYLSRGLGLIAAYKHDRNIRTSTEDIDPRSFADWLVATRQPFLKSGAWRVQRQAATAGIYTIPSIYIDEAIGILNEDFQVGDDEGHPGAGSRANKGLNAEFMIYDHFQRLKQKLKEMGTSGVCLALRDWLDAGIYTGLRPMEWELAFIEKHPDRLCPHGERIWLHVVGARGEHGHGTYRSLEVSGFSVDALSAVERTVQRSHVWTLSGQWPTRQSEVSRLFCSTCDELFPRMRLKYTLYSLRHQFIANMSTVYNRERVVAMSGHDVTRAQREHYTKRRIVWTEAQLEGLPEAVTEQVARMRRRLRTLDEWHEIKSLKDAARRILGKDEEE